MSRPWWRKTNKAWYATIDGKQELLCKAKSKSDRKGRDKADDELQKKLALRQTVGFDATIAGVFEQFLEWSEANQATKTYPDLLAHACCALGIAHLLEDRRRLRIVGHGIERRYIHMPLHVRLPGQDECLQRLGYCLVGDPRHQAESRCYHHALHNWSMVALGVPFFVLRLLSVAARMSRRAAPFLTGRNGPVADFLALGRGGQKCGVKLATLVL